MKKWIVAVLFSATLHAVGFEVAADYLYWKASTQGAFFGQSATKLFYVRPKYEPGVRVQIRYICASDCYDLASSFISVRSKQTKETGQTLEFPPVGVDQSGARARVKYDYLTGDVNVGIRFCRGSRRLIRLFVGFEAVQIDEKHDFLYAGATTFRQKPCYRALGPLIGIGAQYRVWKMLRVVGEVGVAALFSRRSLTTTNETYPSSNGVNPAFRVKVGLNYTYLCLRAEVGYMSRHYPNAFVQTLLRDPTGHPRLDISTEDVTYGGPYASLTLRF